MGCQLRLGRCRSGRHTFASLCSVSSNKMYCCSCYTNSIGLLGLYYYYNYYIIFFLVVEIFIFGS